MLNSVSKTYRSLVLQFTAWLIFAGIAGSLTFMVWVASAVKPTQKAKQNSEVATIIDPNILLVNHNPNEMHKLVRPITFDAIVRDKRNYPKEFKDSRFIKSNLNRYTVQVMNVEKHELITDYLASREDRDKFNYFRIIDSQTNQKRFVLTYGIYNSAQEARGVSITYNAQFNLPKDVQVFPEEFKLYLSQMDEYEISPSLQDIGKNAPKDVNLNPTRKELPAKTTEPKPETEKPAKSIENSANISHTLHVEEKQAPNQNPLVNNVPNPERQTPEKSQPKENRVVNQPEEVIEHTPKSVPKNVQEPEQKLPQPIPIKQLERLTPKRETAETPDLPIPTPEPQD